MNDPIFTDTEEPVVERNLPVLSTSQGEERGIIFPVKCMGETDRILVAEQIGMNLIEVYDAPTAYVMLHHAEDILKKAKESLKEKAINGLTGKETAINGAKVAQRRVTEYDYHEDTVLADLEIAKKATMEAIKDRKTFLEKMKEEMAGTGTGEVVRPAELIRDGLNLAVTLPK